MTYCANKDCPFGDCDKHLDNAPKTGPVVMAWFDKTCGDYIGWLVDEGYMSLRKKLEEIAEPVELFSELKDYKEGYKDGVVEFVKYLKDNSCFYDIDNYHSFKAVNIDDLDDLVEEFLRGNI